MKYFLNTIWRPQLSFLVAAIMVFLMLPCLPSCETNIVHPEKKEVSIFEQPDVLAVLQGDAEVIRKDLGGVHNNIIKRFFSESPVKIGEKIPLDDFRRIFLKSFNEEFAARNLQIRLTEADMTLLLRKMAEFIKDTGIDFYNPETINPPEALDELVRKGYITEEDARRCKHIVKHLDEGVSPYEDDHGLLTASLPSSNSVRTFEEIITDSYDLWTEEISSLLKHNPEEPDTAGFDWIAYMEKIGPFIADGLGGIAGGLMFIETGPVGIIIGGVVGCAFASIAFVTITFLGNAGYL